MIDTTRSIFSISIMASYFGNLILFLAVIQSAIAAVTFTVPKQAHTGGYRYAPLDPAPVGIS